MPFTSAYRSIEHSIVAIVQKFHHTIQPLPEIIGTGFFVSEHGLICTNRHVLDACLALPCPDDYEGLPFGVLAFREVEFQGKPHWAYSPLNVTIHGDVAFTGEKPDYLEEPVPDVAFLLTEYRETPSVTFSDRHVAIGESVAFAGFPMGLRPLLGHNGFLQTSATLHAGVVGAIHPNRLAATPHGFLVHANTQRGASGSPVFRPAGSIVGMVYMVIPEFYPAFDQSDSRVQPFYYEVPTALTGCISGIRIAEAVALASEAAARLTNRPLFSEKLKTARLHTDGAAMTPFETR